MWEIRREGRLSWTDLLCWDLHLSKRGRAIGERGPVNISSTSLQR